MLRSVCLCLILMLVALVETSALAAPQQAAPEAVGMSAERLARITGLMQSYVDDGRLAGAVTIVGRHGRVVYHEAVGTLDLETGAQMEPDSLFRIYSMSKPIVSMAALTLYEEGRFQLNDPVGDYIPELAGLEVLEDGKRGRSTAADDDTSPLDPHFGAQLRLLARQRDRPALPEDQILGSSDLDEMIERLTDIPLQFHPGARWNYSVSTDVLGALIERVAGRPLDELLAERIFVPLEMSDTSFAVADGQDRALRNQPSDQLRNR